MRIPIYFTPTVSNCRIVGHLIERGKPAFLQWEFISLHFMEPERIDELQTISGRAIFIWGDGQSHHESYYFTKGHVRHKLNIDGHSDYRALNYFVNCSNHMHYSEKDGIVVFTPKAISPDVSLASNQENILRAIEMAKTVRGELGITIDLDAVNTFPVIGSWITENGVGGQDIIKAVAYLAARTTRFDMGGVIENLPAFQIVEDGNAPDYDTVFYFSKYYADKRDGTPFKNVDLYEKPLTDAICSHAFFAYERILEAIVGAWQAKA